MAASKTYFARANYRFLPTDQTLTKGSTMFELDESEVWNMEARSASPEFQKASSRISRKSTSLASRVDGGPASLPVNVPDWSKILKEEYKENRRGDSDGDDFEDEYGENGNRIPPHEFLARQMARTRMISFSVHEGIGRTLKGRDLSTVRNAIWEKTGFQD
ncbi:uncharacterized protein LOC111393495 [Olea europaea var. sylvestris]|uniref:uncharacterized protein LOC111393495 n=1 Tax=Olea europaea var. sylvestris TaxID=158386 RepID=UPI000C1D8C7B|nr:uncharacterized protein LOC111393495 [Olea europaea var. sylvestris]